MFESKLFKKEFPIEAKEEKDRLLLEHGEVLKKKMRRYKTMCKFGFAKTYDKYDVELKKEPPEDRKGFFKRIMYNVSIMERREHDENYKSQKNKICEVKYCVERLCDGTLSVEDMNLILLIDGELHRQNIMKLLKGMLLAICIIVFVYLCMK